MKQDEPITCCYPTCNGQIKGKEFRNAVRISQGWMHQHCYEAQRKKIQEGYERAIAEGRHPKPST